MTRDKSPKAHGNEEQMNISVYHMLQSRGVQAISYLRTKAIMKLIFWPQQSYLDLKILVSTLPNWAIINDWRYTLAAFEKSRQLEEFNRMHLLLNSLSLKDLSPRDLGSLGNRQLLQLQNLSPNFLKFLGPSLCFSIIIDR